MGDVGDTFRDFKAYKRHLRDLYGIECPRCKEQRPKACPMILMPGQKCFDGYRDPRPRLTKEQQSIDGWIMKWSNRSAKHEH